MTQEATQITTTPPLPGLKLVQDVNKALATIATDFAGPNDPAALAGPYTKWLDTSTNPPTLRRRNVANSAWEKELGTAAARDVGTEPGEIPTNDDLGAAAYLPIATTPQAQALTNDATVITPKKLGDAMNAHVLGMGQTWQYVKASRSLNVTYTNTTGRSIMVTVRILFGTSFWSGTLVVDGIETFSVASSATINPDLRQSVTGIVPAGSTYRVVGEGVVNLQTWSELRQ